MPNECDEPIFEKCQIAQFGELLGQKSGQDLGQLESDLKYLAEKHRLSWAQDEDEPSRAKRKKSIKAVRNAAEKLNKALHNLSLDAECDLVRHCQTKSA